GDVDGPAKGLAAELGVGRVVDEGAFLDGGSPGCDVQGAPLGQAAWICIDRGLVVRERAVFQAEAAPGLVDGAAKGITAWAIFREDAVPVEHAVLDVRGAADVNGSAEYDIGIPGEVTGKDAVLDRGRAPDRERAPLGHARRNPAEYAEYGVHLERAVRR